MLCSLMENVFLKFGFEVPGKVLDSLFSLSQGLPEKQNRKQIIYINIKYVSIIYIYIYIYNMWLMQLWRLRSSTIFYL